MTDVRVDATCSESESEVEGSCCSGEERSRSNGETRSSHGRIGTTFRFDPRMVGSWTPVHVCHILSCGRVFVCPEHLRRHVKSKHSQEKEHRCVVPECKMSFARSDNLRSHYWTHLQRGGRVGKNKKFTLAELGNILGQNEKTLIRRLRKKLKQHHVKMDMRKGQAAHLNGFC